MGMLATHISSSLVAMAAASGTPYGFYYRLTVAAALSPGLHEVYPTIIFTGKRARRYGHDTTRLSSKNVHCYCTSRREGAISLWFCVERIIRLHENQMSIKINKQAEKQGGLQKGKGSLKNAR